MSPDSTENTKTKASTKDKLKATTLCTHTRTENPTANPSGKAPLFYDFSDKVGSQFVEFESFQETYENKQKTSHGIRNEAHPDPSILLQSLNDLSLTSSSSSGSSTKHNSFMATNRMAIAQLNNGQSESPSSAFSSPMCAALKLFPQERESTDTPPEANGQAKVAAVNPLFYDFSNRVGSDCIVSFSPDSSGSNIFNLSSASESSSTEETRVENMCQMSFSEADPTAIAYLNNGGEAEEHSNVAKMVLCSVPLSSRESETPEASRMEFDYSVPYDEQARYEDFVNESTPLTRNTLASEHREKYPDATCTPSSIQHRDDYVYHIVDASKSMVSSSDGEQGVEVEWICPTLRKEECNIDLKAVRQAANTRGRKDRRRDNHLVRVYAWAQMQKELEIRSTSRLSSLQEH